MSVISNIAKIFEKKIIKTKLINFFMIKQYTFYYQFGFRSNKSTDIANVPKLIYTALEERKKCAKMYLDLANTFDVIDHDKLLSKNRI